MCLPAARLHAYAKLLAGCLVAMSCAALAGCAEFFIRDADREVYRLIEKRQRQAIGTSTDVRIDGPAAQGNEPGARPLDTEPYAFVPHPIDDDMPASFTAAPTATRPAEVPSEPNLTTQPVAASATTQPDGAVSTEPEAPPPEPVVPGGPTTASTRREMNLEEVLAYAFRHSRQFQTAKEDLYLAALDLTLERHLWTPRFFGEVSALKTIQQTARADERGNVTFEPDNALEAVARAGVRQRLPYGGEIVAETINTLVRNVSEHLTEGETGQTVIAADLPLLRGAGRAAFETRYQAERNLIYAIRTFEGFRRNLVVEIAAEYFNLQRLRQQIINTDQSVQSLELLAQQTRALFESGRRSVLDVQRADQERLVATNDRVDAITTYQTALDAFKLTLGMPLEEPINVPLPSEPGESGANADLKGEESLEAALRMPAVSEEEAIAAALKYRLDLLNDLDRIGDAERGVNIAENNLLPDLRATSSVRFNTRPDQRGIGHYDDEHTVYTAGLALELPLDRKAERNLLRQSIIGKNEALRNYEQARDEVIRQVRSAMRRVQQQELSLQIQVTNRDLALQRREAARFQLERGLIGNRDVVEAENALLAARNRLAAAQAQLSLSILQFRRDTGTLRVDDQGRWSETRRQESQTTGEKPAQTGQGVKTG